jgi:hypothetical protein
MNPPDAGAAPIANGTVGAWQTEPPMLTPRANHCAATTQGYLFVLGGNHQDSMGNFVNIGTVDAAQLQPDGSLGAWKQAGTLPNPMSPCMATADATRLDIVDAVYDDDMTYGRQLWVAEVGTDGSLGTWTALATLPGTVRVLLQQAWVSNGELIAMTSASPPDGNGTEALVIAVPGTGIPTATSSRVMVRRCRNERANACSLFLIGPPELGWRPSCPSPPLLTRPARIAADSLCWPEERRPCAGSFPGSAPEVNWSHRHSEVTT